MIPRAKHARATRVYGPHMQMLAAMSVGDITPTEDNVQNAVTECTVQECTQALTRISKDQRPEIRTQVSSVLASRNVPGGTVDVILVHVAKALIPADLLKTAKEDMAQQDPRRVILEDFARCASELRIPAGHANYADLTQDGDSIGLKWAAAGMREMSVGRIPTAMIDVFTGLGTNPTDPTIVYAYRTVLITQILTGIALGAWGLALRRRVQITEIHMVLWQEPGAIDAVLRNEKEQQH